MSLNGVSDKEDEKSSKTVSSSPSDAPSFDSLEKSDCEVISTEPTIPLPPRHSIEPIDSVKQMEPIPAEESNFTSSIESSPPSSPSPSLNSHSHLPLDFSEPPPLNSLHIDEVEPPQSPPGSSDDFKKPPVVAQKPRSNNLGHWAPLGRKQPEDPPLRPRTEEIKSGSKLVPKIESSPGDFFHFDVEVETWFGAAGVNVDDWLRYLDHSTTIHGKYLHGMLRDGTRFSSVAAIREHIALSCQTLMQDPQWVSEWSFTDKLNNFEQQTLLFFLLCTVIYQNKVLLDKGLELVQSLIEQVAARRWFMEEEDSDDDTGNAGPATAKVDKNESSHNGSGYNSSGGNGTENGEEGNDIVHRSTNLGRLFILVRLAILATFGDAESLKSTQTQIWENCGLVPFSSSTDTKTLHKEDDAIESKNKNGNSLLIPDEREYGSDYTTNTQFTNSDDIGHHASPINYANFMEAIATRYPGFVQPNDYAQRLGSCIKDMGKRGLSKPAPEKSGEKLGRSRNGIDEMNSPDPRDLGGNYNQPAMPYVPSSIREACILFRAHVKVTPAVLQLYEQYQTRFDADSQEPQYLHGPSVHPEPPMITIGRQLYINTLNVQKSFVQVVIDYIVHHGKGPSAYTHAALATIWHMLQWFECTHILMFENLAGLLFDCQFHLLAHMFCTRYPRVCQYALEAYPSQEFWVKAGRLSKYDGVPLNTDNEKLALIVTQYNKYNLQVYTHLMGICRLITSGKTQRLLVVAELPVDPFKSIFGIYEKKMWLQVLRFLKAQSPFTGRRWRYLNMEIISAIYLHVPSEIEDVWLTSLDVGQAIRDAPAEELALRNLIVNFNNKLVK